MEKTVHQNACGLGQSRTKIPVALLTGVPLAGVSQCSTTSNLVKKMIAKKGAVHALTHGPKVKIQTKLKIQCADVLTFMVSLRM